MRRVDLLSKPLLLGLLAASFLAGAFPGQACQYCRLAATDPEAAKMAAKMHAGGFPLDATLNQFQPLAPAATLTAPPDPDNVVTRAADLPVTARVPAVPKSAMLSTSPSATPALAKPVAPAGTAVITQANPAPVARWADAGLLGLLSVGGWFCWRTRRVSAPVG